MEEILNNGFTSETIKKDNAVILKGRNKNAIERYIKLEKNINFISKYIKSVKLPANLELICPNQTYKFGALKYDYIVRKTLTDDIFNKIDFEKLAIDLSIFLNEMYAINIYSFDKTFSKQQYLKEELLKIE